MTTQEVAARLVELFNQGLAVQAEEELYAQEVVSFEQDPTMAPVHGLEAVINKTKAAFANTEMTMSGSAAHTFINHDTFLIHFPMEITPKGGETMHIDEYGFYRVKDGKVVEEYFYSQPM